MDKKIEIKQYNIFIIVVICGFAGTIFGLWLGYDFPELAEFFLSIFW